MWVIISNDSDLAEPLRLIKAQHSNKTIGLISPVMRGTVSQELSQHANFTKRIRAGVLKISQLPSPIPGTNIHKPTLWQ